MSTETPPRRSAVVRIFDRSVVALNAIGSLWVLLLVLLICADSFGRSFFNHPIDGVTELVAVSIAVIVFCQLPDTARLGRLTRSETFLYRLQASNSMVARLVVVGFDLLGAAVMAAIIVGTTPLLIESFERGYYIGEHGIFTLPDWPLKALVVLGGTATMLCFIARAVQHWLQVRERQG
ncbi:MAG: TRAP transporter small permease [Betaproteobacteria bacterium]|jgi:TRAP-type mannitol/chloroaromatic compound transport system permease small subunit|nr:TRAP transporter small permease [Betaproteobacteria bacterium]